MSSPIQMKKMQEEFGLSKEEIIEAQRSVNDQLAGLSTNIVEARMECGESVDEDIVAAETIVQIQSLYTKTLKHWMEKASDSLERGQIRAHEKYTRKAKQSRYARLYSVMRMMAK